jgi:hypothetical protein
MLIKGFLGGARVVVRDGVVSLHWDTSFAKHIKVRQGQKRQGNAHGYGSAKVKQLVHVVSPMCKTICHRGAGK